MTDRGSQFYALRGQEEPLELANLAGSPANQTGTGELPEFEAIMMRSDYHEMVSRGNGLGGTPGLLHLSFGI